MSTSPSWFDQEKFSRLVKKVGPKNLSEPPPATPAPTPAAAPAPAPSASQPLPMASPAAAPVTPAPSASQPLPTHSASPRLPEPPQNGPGLEPATPMENLAPTARISLVSKPPSLLSENRALPALPRRTTPLPGLKSLFQFPSAGDKPGDESPSVPVAEMPSVITQPLPEPAALIPEAPAEAKSPDSLAVGEDDLAGIWQKMALLNEELAQTIQERDHAVSDINVLRDQLKHADDVIENSKANATTDELAHVARERDDAVAELKAMKDKVPSSDSQKIQLPEGVTKTREIVFLTQERDQARNQYADLRTQFESLKRDQTGALPSVREDSGKARKEMEQQLEGFRAKLEEKNKELTALRSNPPAAATPPPLPFGGGDGDEKTKAEVTALKEQLVKAKEDASIAQRGLALSQKALQETRDTLREATEGTSLSRHNFDNLKTECASLTQQITVLQAQNEQLSRELAAVKVRQSGRLT